MSTLIELPSGMRASYEQLFPTLDFSRIRFFTGVPPLFPDRAGLTLSAGIDGIEIFIRPDRFDPCSPDANTFALIEHELIHALQAQQGLLGGRLNAWTFSYVFCWVSCFFKTGSNQGNTFENEAYSFENRLKECMANPSAIAPVFCLGGQIDPVPDFTAVLLRRCPDLLIAQAKANFGDCLPWDTLGPLTVLWAGVAGAIAGGAALLKDIGDAVEQVCEWLGFCSDDHPSLIYVGPGEKSGKGPKRVDEL
jgi:hypothetical protein